MHSMLFFDVLILMASAMELCMTTDINGSE